MPRSAKFGGVFGKVERNRMYGQTSYADWSQPIDKSSSNKKAKTGDFSNHQVKALKRMLKESTADDETDQEAKGSGDDEPKKKKVTIKVVKRKNT